MEEKYSYKNGDVLFSEETLHTTLFKSYDCNSKQFFFTHITLDNGDLTYNYEHCKTMNFRHATEKEKRCFMKVLKKHNIFWDEEKEELIKEPFLKRVEKGKDYLYINDLFKVCRANDLYNDIDNERWEIGNYYHPLFLSEAEEDVKKIKKLMKRKHNKK